MINSIKSYGVILYNLDEETKNLSFLIYQRRDTFEYTDFLCGMYYQESHLMTLLSLITREERERLLNFSFQELWDDMWLDPNCKIYRDRFAYAKDKFELIQKDLPFLFYKLGTTKEIAPWGFPKGKKAMKETELNCALREFEEEVGVSISTFKIKDQTASEFYRGSNKKSYSTLYFLVQSPEKFLPEKQTIENRIRNTTVTEEASDVKWVSLNESRFYLNDKRFSLLQNISRSL
jgi:ADP-ribose pyrophosphatase YjhB (NUDIX family)